MEQTKNNIDERIKRDESIVFDSYKTNTFYNKQVFVLDGHSTRQEVLFQLFGNLGCQATKHDNPQTADFILLNSSNNSNLPEIITFGNSNQSIKATELVKEKGELKFITEKSFLNYVFDRTKLINDSATIHLLKQI